MVQTTGQQSYQAFRDMLNLPTGDGDPRSFPLPLLPIPPFEVPATVAAEAARVAAAEELEEITLQQGTSREAIQSPQTCKLRLDNFLDPLSESSDDEEDAADPSGGLLPGMVNASSEPPAPDAVGCVALHRPAAVRATPPPEDADPEGLLAAVGAQWDPEDEEDEGPPSHAPTTMGQAEGEVAAFSLDPLFDYDNVQCSERFSVETAMREGEFYDRSRMPPA